MREAQRAWLCHELGAFGDNESLPRLIAAAPMLESRDAQITCLNCGTRFTGNFCPECGQKHGPAMPSTKEVLGDMMRSALSPHGKLLETLRVLLFKPGELTRTYIAGQRHRYVHPVRLYLLAVFVFVAVVGINNTWREWTGQKSFEVTANKIFERKKPEQTATAAGNKGGESESTKLGKSVGSAVRENLPPWLADIAKERALRLKELTPEQAEARAMQNLSRSYSFIFALLVPFAAAINWLLYLGRGVSYAGHFVFWLHGTAALSLIMVLPFAVNQPVIYFPVYFLGLVWSVLAGKRAFGVSLFGSTWRYVLLVIPSTILSAFLAVLFVAAMTIFG